MKKLSKYLLLTVFITVFFQSCTEPPSYPKYYQLKNETGTDVFIKFYYSEYGSGIREYESFNLKNNESSAVFYAMIGEVGSHSKFISYTDSIDIYINNDLVKRYKRIYSINQTPPKKSLYYDFNYDTIIKSENGHDVNVYKILKSDFE